MTTKRLIPVAFRRRWFVGQIGAIALLSGCGKVLEPDPQTLRRFERIKPGMSRTMVEQIMEARPTMLTASTVVGIEVVRLTWQDGLSMLTVDFVAEHMVAKHRVSRPN